LFYAAWVVLGVGVIFGGRSSTVFGVCGILGGLLTGAALANGLVSGVPPGGQRNFASALTAMLVAILVVGGIATLVF
jgi:phosphate/sulfate permease